MTEPREVLLRRIEAYCSHLERLAWLIPPPNSLCTEIMSTAIKIRNIALELQAEDDLPADASRALASPHQEGTGT